MRRKIKIFKNVLGASLMEVIFVLGIMAVLTPVVFRYAFKDLSDIKYINMANHLKQLIKTLGAYASTEMNSWTNDGVIEQSNGLSKYDLDKNLTDDIKNNLSLMHKKEGDDQVLYGIVDMKDLLNGDVQAFNKTLSYVGDYIGSISGDGCSNGCSGLCVCAINGNWGVSAGSLGLSYDPITNNLADRFKAVIRIDSSLLENEFASSIYLYRNRSDDSKNKMEQNFDFSGCPFEEGSTNCDIKNVNTTVANVVRGISGPGDNPYVITKLPLVKSKKTEISGSVKVADSIRFRTADTPSLVINAMITVPQVIFEKLTQLASFIVKNATMLPGRFESTNAVIETESLIFNKFDLQELTADTLTSTVENIFGFNPDESYNQIKNSIDSRLRVEVSKFEVSNLQTRILNVKKNNMVVVSGPSFRNGKITHSNTFDFHIQDIKGTAGGVNVWDFVNSFNNAVNNVKTTCINSLSAQGYGSHTCEENDLPDNN